MRCIAAASPATHTRVPGGEVRPTDGGDERVAGRCASWQGVPLDRRVRTVGQREPGLRVATSMWTCTGGSVGRASNNWQMAGIAVSSPASTNAGASGRWCSHRPGRRPPPGCLAHRLCPLGHHPGAMGDDLDIELQGHGVYAARCEGPDRGASPVGQGEPIAVPARYHQLVRASRREQQPHTCRPGARPSNPPGRASQGDADQAGANRTTRRTATRRNPGGARR